MPEPDENNLSPRSPQSVCRIDIMFPVESDEQALEVKQKVTEALAKLDKKRIQFSITEM